MFNDVTSFLNLVADPNPDSHLSLADCQPKMNEYAFATD